MAYRSEVREEKKRETRRALVEAAIRLFVAEGLDAPSLDAICKEAGCTRGAYYVHFRDRDDLACAAMEQAITDFMSEIFRDQAESGDPLHFADAFLDAIASEGHIVGGGATRIRFHHLLAACAKHAPIREQYLGLLSMLAETLRSELAKRMPVRDAAIRAESSVLLMLGLLANVDLGRKIDLKATKKLVRELLSPPPPPHRA